jgi:hypothetical protein
VAEPIEDNDRIVGIEWELVIAWRIEQRLRELGDEWIESVSAITLQNVSSRAQRHAVIRYPDGNIVTLYDRRLADEKAVIEYFQHEYESDEAARLKRQTKAAEQAKAT